MLYGERIFYYIMDRITAGVDCGIEWPGNDLSMSSCPESLDHLLRLILLDLLMRSRGIRETFYAQASMSPRCCAGTVWTTVKPDHTEIPDGVDTSIVTRRILPSAGSGGSTTVV